jgi:hypothetical protein
MGDPFSDRDRPEKPPLTNSKTVLYKAIHRATVLAGLGVSPGRRSFWISRALEVDEPHAVDQLRFDAASLEQFEKFRLAAGEYFDRVRRAAPFS